MFRLRLGGRQGHEQSGVRYGVIVPSHVFMQLSTLATVSSIDLERAGTPAFMAVVTAIGRYAYRLDDGVGVVPLSTLAP